MECTARLKGTPASRGTKQRVFLSFVTTRSLVFLLFFSPQESNLGTKSLPTKLAFPASTHTSTLRSRFPLLPFCFIVLVIPSFYKSAFCCCPFVLSNNIFLPPKQCLQWHCRAHTSALMRSRQGEHEFRTMLAYRVRHYLKTNHILQFLFSFFYHSDSLSRLV